MKGADWYQKIVNQTPKLSREDELSLILKAKGGDKVASDKLFRANLKYVLAIASEYIRYNFPMDEVIAEGWFGLVDGLRRFEPERQLRFITYAAFWIRARIGNYIRTHWGITSSSGGALRSKTFANLMRQVASLEASGHTRSEIVDMLTDGGKLIPREKAELYLSQLYHRDVSVDEHDIRFVEPYTPEDALLQKENKEQQTFFAREALSSLDSRVRQVILEREDGSSLQKIGDEFGISRERVRQLEVRGRERMSRTLKRKDRVCING